MTDKPDKYHYHEFIHTTSLARELIDSHLLGHHLGDKYKKELSDIDDLLIKLYNKVSNDSDELWPDQ
ncbi:hypothetical protein KAR91_27590 [Candidatus Pacearchaeota archaeon]|nr:hypothetical protein [Candidatus Pacearchaeota archaeon]